MTEPLRTDGPQVLAEHIATCRPDIDATIVMHQGSADYVVQQMLDAGWTWGAETEYVAGKRIRTLIAPGRAKHFDGCPQVGPVTPYECDYCKERARSMTGG